LNGRNGMAYHGVVAIVIIMCCSGKIIVVIRSVLLSSSGLISFCRKVYMPTVGLFWWEKNEHRRSNC